MKRTDRYLPRSWIDPRIEVHESPVHGRGQFAAAPIRVGESAVVWGGTLILTSEEIDGARRQEWLQKGYAWAWIGEDAFLAEQLAGDEDLTELMNHSCDPNLWFADEVTLVARRDIGVGQELTIDYAMFEGCEEWVPGWECRCGSDCCRGVLTGRDWRRVDIQARYASHFSPFINDRIRRVLDRATNGGGQ